MAKRHRWYVGCISDFYSRDYRYEAFKSQTKPTKESHGHRYRYTIGPFNTEAGARWAEKYGKRNPHFTGVEAAERFTTQQRKAQ